MQSIRGQVDPTGTGSIADVGVSALFTPTAPSSP
jgi:hypothetical protein